MRALGDRVPPVSGNFIDQNLIFLEPVKLLFRNLKFSQVDRLGRLTHRPSDGQHLRQCRGDNQHRANGFIKSKRGA